MTKLWSNVWVLGATVMGLALGAPVLAVTSGVGPYYATPSWDQTLPVATRFIVLTNMNSAAVLDRETGLVWEQSPGTSTFEWVFASFSCNQRSTGGRMGWRLPTVQELGSLIEPNPFPSQSLPSGHPFINVSATKFYWSATSSALFFPERVWVVDFYRDDITSINVGVANKAVQSGLVWCVRGGQGVNPQ